MYFSQINWKENAFQRSTFYKRAANQCGFREKHSTNLALLDLVDQVSTELGNKQYMLLGISLTYRKPLTFWVIKF